jgi:phospholipase C
MDIEHVIVLMLENHSFNRMLGVVPGVDGVDPVHPRSNPNLSNQLVFESSSAASRTLCDPTDPKSKGIDPHHDLNDVLEQMVGPNQGFVKNFQRNYPSCKPAAWTEVMQYFPLGSLPALHSLAQSFAVCQNWFSSLPGPTWPNRYFIHSGTSLGHTDMPQGIFHPAVHFYNQVTVYNRLDQVNKSWRIYYGDVSQALTLVKLWTHADEFSPMSRFFDDVKGPESDFPSYTFIEPAYFWPRQNDQHPPTDVLLGDSLLAAIYNAIRGNDALWQKSLLVILYDEHGGFHDHIAAPAATPVDARPASFDFKQYGLRIPAVLVSPWLEPQIISDTLDHTSLLRFVSDKWGLGSLGARTAVAKSFASSWKVSNTLRTDVPQNLPESRALPNEPQPELNPNQLALKAFGAFLDTKSVELSAKISPAAASRMTMEVGKRALRSHELRLGSQEEVVVEQFETFLNLSRQAGGPVRAAVKKPTGKKPSAKAAAPAKPAKKVAAKSAKKAAAKKSVTAAIKAGAKAPIVAATKKSIKAFAIKGLVAGSKKGAKKKSPTKH